MWLHLMPVALLDGHILQIKGLILKIPKLAQNLSETLVFIAIRRKRTSI